MVEQAILLLDQAYVHLPVKRARYAVDPVQRLRLLQHRLEATGPDDDLGPELEFHAELIDIFTSLRDLHTQYVPPLPYRSHAVFLPFLVEQYGPVRAPRYVVSKVAAGAGLPAHFRPGVEVTHWNGTPVERAVARVAEHQGGGNHDARTARGLDALTIRSLAVSPLPDEDWVDVSYRDHDGLPRQVRVRWSTYRPADPSPFADPSDGGADRGADRGADAVLGLDSQTAAVNVVRRDLFARLRPAVPGTEPDDGVEPELGTTLPAVLRARIRRTLAGDVLHLRIFTFLVPDPDGFVQEVRRLLLLRPTVGVVLDVRGNGGGDIRAAEQLLQLFTPHRIEPEPAQFIVSPLTRRLCTPGRADGVDLSRWNDSVQAAVESGATFSTGFPIGSPAEANRYGQQYYGPVVLVVDARCYSATDIFAAGFQDHDIGPVLGTAEHTGAGGANVWTHDLLRRLLPTGGSGLQPLPRGASFRVAVRRTTRVGSHAGELLEDLGVTCPEPYPLTLDDLVGDNRDLLEAAAALIADRPSWRLEASLEQRAGRLRIVVSTDRLGRVDAYADGRPAGSHDVRDGRCSFEVDRTLFGPGRSLRLEGFGADGLAAVRTLTVPG